MKLAAVSLATLNIIPVNYSPPVFATDRFKVWNDLYSEWLNSANISNHQKEFTPRF